MGKVTKNTFAVIVVTDEEALIYQSNDRRLLVAKVNEAKRKKLPYVILRNE